MAHIALYFGSFNPIHIGHVKVAELVHINKKKLVDEVWFMPAPLNPLKTPEGMADFNDRVNMVNLMIGNKKGFSISLIEEKMSIPNYTHNTMEYIRKNYPEHIFSIIIGADNYKILNTWKKSEEIISNHSFFVIARDGEDFSHMENDKFIFLPEVDTVSATKIREKIKKGESITEYTSENVANYIAEKKLYLN